MRNETSPTVTDWVAIIKLALVVSLFAAAAAAALVGHVAERTIVVSVILVATVASWYQLEHAGVKRH